MALLKTLTNWVLGEKLSCEVQRFLFLYTRVWFHLFFHWFSPKRNKVYYCNQIDLLKFVIQVQVVFPIMGLPSPLFITLDCILGFVADSFITILFLYFTGIPKTNYNSNLNRFLLISILISINFNRIKLYFATIAGFYLSCQVSTKH